MRIVNVAIHNFRSIADTTFDLTDYSLLIGANNSGKTNVMDALRVFYEHGIKYEAGRDFPKFPTDDKESWIDLELELTEAEYASLKEDYRQPHNRTKVRKYLATAKAGSDGKPIKGIYAYVGDKLSDQHFYGAKNVQEGKLGDVIHIPAVSRLDDHTKLTGPSALRDLVDDIVKKVLKSNTTFSSLTEQFTNFGTTIKGDATPDGKSIAQLEQDINADIADWSAEFQLVINPINEDQIVKNLVDVRIFDTELSECVQTAQCGAGFQRSLIFTLIRTAAAYQAAPATSTKKDFTPQMTLLLFEEPEAFLHPTQQTVLRRSLQALSSGGPTQVLVSSHSPQFVSHSTDDLPSIIRLARVEARTQVGQVKANELSGLFADNLQMNELLNDSRYAAEADDWKEDMEAVKYFLWLDPERCGMFFARHVLLVEGPTERALIYTLIDEGKVEPPKGGVFVLDCLGKFNLHRFMNLLGMLKVEHSVLFDLDGEKEPHKKIAEFIKDSANAYTKGFETFLIDIETYLGISLPKKTYRKPQHMMLKYRNGAIPEEGISNMCAFLNALIGSTPVPDAPLLKDAPGA